MTLNNKNINVGTERNRLRIKTPIHKLFVIVPKISKNSAYAPKNLFKLSSESLDMNKFYFVIVRCKGVQIK